MNPFSRNTLRCCDTAGWLIANSAWICAPMAPADQLAPGKQFENAPTDRVAEYIERVHIHILKYSTYISQY